MRKLKVYLADLRHNYIGVLASDAMPIGVGFMKAVMDRDLPEVDAEIFAYPEVLLEKLKTDPPGVLMLTNYMWNEALSDFFSQFAKTINPNILVIWGGPNIPIESDRKVQYVAKRPNVDLYVTGEGDFHSSEILKAFLGQGLSIKGLLSEDIHSAVYRKDGGELINTPIQPRGKSLDDIPSPWLTGVMDRFFDGKMAPLFETNRGCPFTCTFCVQGTSWYTKVNYFGMDRLKEEIFYIAKKIKEESPSMITFRIADPNFGMFERDIQLSGWLGETQSMFDYPLYIDATTGKNRADRIIKSIEKVNGALVMYQAVQSLDETVLKNIKRSNIKLETYAEVQMHVRGRGLRSSSDLILGLPGETLQTHLTSLFKLLNSGTHNMNNFQAMVLKGSELETLEHREKFGFGTKFRLLPKNFGIYEDQKVLGAEEVIVSTDSLSFDDYLTARTYHLAVSIFWNESRFEEMVKWVERLGHQGSDWMEAVVARMKDDNPALNSLVEDFIRETKGELFDTEEETLEYYAKEENFERLLRSEIGDNLIYGYRGRASFRDWQAVCLCAMNATRDLVEAHKDQLNVSDFDAFWKDLCAFIELRHAWGADLDAIEVDRSAIFSHDIGKWLADGLPNEIERYHLPQPTEFTFRLSEENKAHLSAAIQTWTASLKGLVMLVRRVQPGWQRKTCQGTELVETARP